MILHKLAKGYLFAVWAIIINALRGIPPEERIELVFEAQHHYEIWVRMIFTAFREWRTSTGEQKLAGIKFISKESSMLTQPADYLAFALLQGFRDRSSRKSQWCAPIFHGKGKVGFGAHLTREQVRTIALAMRVYEEEVIAVGKAEIAKGYVTVESLDKRLAAVLQKQTTTL